MFFKYGSSFVRCYLTHLKNTHRMRCSSGGKYQKYDSGLLLERARLPYFYLKECNLPYVTVVGNNLYGNRSSVDFGLQLAASELARTEATFGETRKW